MAYTATIGINPLPAVYTVTGGGSYCAGGNGVSVSLNNSTFGVQYQLYNGSMATGAPVAGTGSAISFGAQTSAGIYSVQATNAATGCRSDMSGTATVNIDAAPAVHTVSSGGSYCSGETGVGITLNGSNTGISYRLYQGTTAVGSSISGTGGIISFGTYSASGTYSVQATDMSTGCQSAMSGAASISIHALPVVYNVTGGGSYCSGGTGVAVGLSNSTLGISYRLYKDGIAVGEALPGSGSALSFGMQTVGGNYTVAAMNTVTGCSRSMNGSRTVIVNALPLSYNVTGGGSYCAGGIGFSIGLEGSQTGISYRLYRGSVAEGAAVAGTGSAISFGTKTAAGNYTIVATNTTEGCVREMSGSATININALPVVYNVTGGGSYCAGSAGVPVGLEGSNTGINYTLYHEGVSTGITVSGTGSAISFGIQTAGGNYSVVAADVTSGCSRNMSGSRSITINNLPVVHTVSASASSYCAGGAGVTLSLSGSENGISYQLYYGATASGTAVTGTGSAVSFGNRTAAGSYSVVATHSSTGCVANMSGSASVSINPLPAVYTVSGGGAVCAGSTGAAVLLSGSEAGVNYTLKLGAATVGSPVSGDGSALNFGPQTAAGTYMVVAANSSTGCSRSMSGNAIVNVNAQPSVYSVTGGGNYCAGGIGMAVGLNGTATGISYQLYKDGVVVGTAVSGTGGSLSFGNQTAAGEYTVQATNNVTTCSRTMSGAATISINNNPESFSVTGGGSYCSGSTGVSIGLSSSATGISYRLYRGSAMVGSAVSGTGSSISFGTQSVAGVYSVAAVSSSTGCASGMSGTTSVVINSLPATQSITGGGSYCAGGSGVAIGISATEAGVSYRLYQGSSAVGTAVTGTGSSISFGMQTAAGSYSVQATNGSGCSRGMSGTATVSITPSVVSTVNMTTSTDLSICSGTLVTYTATAVNGGSSPAYQWKVNGVNMVSGAATYTYAPANGDIVSVAMTSSAACPVTAVSSASVTMTVTTSQTPVVTAVSAVGTTVCKGSAVTYTATGEYGGSAPIYAWMRNGVFQGAGASYTVVPNNGDEIYCIMTSNYECRTANTVTSNKLTMTVTEPATPTVAISANPGTQISAGQSVTFTAVVTNGGSSPSYQWSVNGAAISGATTASFVSTEIAHNDEVSCSIVSSGTCGGVVASGSVVMKVNSVSVADVAGSSMQVQLMPNPNKGTFTVKGTLSIMSGEATIEVTNMLGQIVYRSKATVRNSSIEERITLDNTLANGMYLLHVRSGDNSKVFHFVMEQ